MGNSLTTDKQYRQWLTEIKQRVQSAQLKAATAVNTALLEFYWGLGADIVQKQKQAVWGSGLLGQLSTDLMAGFPGMKGFSLNNLQYIKRWYSFYCGSLPNYGTACSTIAKQPASQLIQIPWGHNLTGQAGTQTEAKADELESTIKKNLEFLGFGE
jgi:predicted nuclease of restriction endonuclease-like (RecB) superfamily